MMTPELYQRLIALAEDANGSEIAASFAVTADEAALLARAIAALPDLIKANEEAAGYIIAGHARQLWNEHPSYEMDKAWRIAKQSPPPVVLQIRAALAKAGVTGEDTTG